MRILTLVLVLAASVSCQDGPAPDATTDTGTEAAPGILPLKEIMGGLERDLADVAHGFWVEDTELVSAAATRIAEHPRVPPEQMGRIQAALTDEFPAFAQMDGRVHDAAVDLAAAADSARAISDLFQGFVAVQNGCLACHMEFRARVSEALAAAGR